MESLHEYEKRILNTLLEHKKLDTRLLMVDTGLDEASIMHAALRLSSKSLIEMSENEEERAGIGPEGKEYIENGLPEKNLLHELQKLGGTVEFELISQKENFNIALNWALRSGWVKITQNEGKMLSLTQEGERILHEETPTESFLKKISGAEIELGELTEGEKKLVGELEKRKKVIRIRKSIHRVYTLTALGEEVAGGGLEIVPELSIITSGLIKSGGWREKKIREYDIEAPVPIIYPGKKHPYLQILDDTKRLLVSMGFEEALGPLVELEFWNFDALFQAQDHPARAIHDSYSVKDLGEGTLPSQSLVSRVKEAHENGGKTGSIGWRYKWDEKKARRLILRSQTTAVSARCLAAGVKPPKKYFCIGRNFRPDVIDATHLPEFFQCEGIVVDYDIGLRELLGLLESFAHEIGNVEKVKFVPGYFPYTEPSVELFGKHPSLGWMELGGAGIFRPEVTIPLGTDATVLAWGLGLDRLAMARLGINDIRKLFSTDLQWLREAKVI